MASGLLALLNDVAAIAKVAAASVDDVAAAAGKAGAKAAGLVIDDAAVTPRYVTGFDAARELPIVWRIALGSLRNKLVFLLPAALLLAAFAPFLITPLLVLGGLYLSFEGAEKVAEWLLPHAPPRAERVAAGTDPARLEEERVAGAIKTDFILSAEIMAITLASIPEGGFWMRAAVLAVVALGMTVAVYGAVALIVKADDAGAAMAAGGRLAATRATGRGVLRAMPSLLAALSVIGTVAMLWVGGGILLHALAEFGLGALPHAIEGLADTAQAAAGFGFASWLVGATLAGLVGLAAGTLALPLGRRLLH